MKTSSSGSVVGGMILFMCDTTLSDDESYARAPL